MTLAPPPAARFQVDRRTILQLGALGVGALAFPGALAAQSARGFTHGVASGEPGADRALLWTRYRGGSDEARLGWEVAETLDFARVVAGGSVTAAANRDFCVKPMATGLAPGRWYYYRFTGPGGEHSPIGRTRTLPQGRVEAFRMAAFSCSNLGFGWFNAYAHAAARDDIDLALHLGDYYYEYKVGDYPSAKQALPGRMDLLSNEAVALADYRLRHAAYRADPDLQRLHQLFPMVVMWDDHETANDSWKGGAENHQPDSEGPWDARKAAARRAYREWLPVSDDDWASYEIGDLATLLRLESRLTARERPYQYPEIAPSTVEGERNAALARFRDGAWRERKRTLLGDTQERWLARAFAASRRADKTWQVVAQQVIMGELYLAPLIPETMPADVSPQVRERIMRAAAAQRLGLPANLDAWDGYPAARDRLLEGARDAGANLVVLAGDSHNAWSFDLAHGTDAAGVEFAGHSVTSPGLENSLYWTKPEALARALVERSPQLKWADTGHRGYMTVELTPARATAEYVFLETIRKRSTALAGTHRLSTLAGTNRLS
ncbi:MAG TPA: alkaline phosphatase D family protein [Novosphingobium sp.]|nr:alkaline phosphatase D family protein [Novosphingobium sp.]